jgi:hypothetical protein
MLRDGHEKISVVMFGNKYTEVHDFLDQYFPVYGMYHRILLHHQAGLNLIVRAFSESVRPAAEQHIIDDIGMIPGDWREFDFDLDSESLKIEL